MKQYMIEFELPEVMSEAFVDRIPAQRDTVNRMLARGIIKSYSLAADRSALWVVMVAEDEFEVQERIAEFPLIDFMTPFVSELMFHNSEEHVLQFSLN